LLINRFKKRNFKIKPVLFLSTKNNNEYSIRSSVSQILPQLKESSLITPNKLNVFGGLVLKNDDNIVINRESYEINNLKYEIVLYQNEIDRLQFEDYKSRIKSIFSKSDFEIIDNEQSLSVLSQKGIKIADLRNLNNIFELTIDASAFLKDLFDLDDIRVLFSTDSRNIVANEMGVKIGGIEFSSICRPFCKETNKWDHDVSFWCEGELDFDRLLKTIREGCFSLVRSICLIDDSFTDGPRRSYCFRLNYESCDRALDWETSRALQNRLRQLLEVKNQLVVR
jgi:phenylalanyl-tRNA synthetase beta subunit